jgi:hypothetical protein
MNFWLTAWGISCCSMLGNYLESQPDATAEVIAYIDTVGSSKDDQGFFERRGATADK